MKELKEKIEKEVTRYEAFDGTKFDSMDACNRYEDTALCVIKAKVKKLIVTEEFNAWDTIGGYEDSSVFGVKLSAQENADTLKQWALLEHTYLNKEEQKEYREKLFDKIDSAIGDIFILGINNSGDWYLVNSRQNIINNLMNLDKKDNA